MAPLSEVADRHQWQLKGHAVEFWPLILLLVAGTFLSVGAFLIVAYAFRDSVPRGLHLAIAVAALTALALVSLLAATQLRPDADQKALAKNIADELRSTPLKVEITGAAPTPVHDEMRLAQAIADRLRATPLDVLVTNTPPFDNAALATAIAQQLPSPSLSPLIDSQTATGIALVLLVLSLVVLILRAFRGGEKPFLQDRTVRLALAAMFISLALGALPYLLPARPDPQLVVTFDNSPSRAGAVFFDASPRPIHFGSGNEQPAAQDVCDAKKILNARGSTVAIVVGSHDQLALTDAASIRFSTNAGLARQRAEAVRALLIGTQASCDSPSISTVIALSDSPVNVGPQNRSDRELEADRTVRIFGLATR